MTRPARHVDDHVDAQQALQAYVEHPLEDGDALLLLDDAVCLELQGLANAWDDVGRRTLVDLLATTSRRVVVAIARTGGELLPGDYRIWRELHELLRDTEVDLLPVRGLPAA